VKRNFTPEAPNRLWVADITYVRSWEGWLYLSFILDTFSRRIVGWSISNHLKTELVLDAVNMAIYNRRPVPGLIHHSDQGSQYTSVEFASKLTEAGFLPSMGSGDGCLRQLHGREFRLDFEARAGPLALLADPSEREGSDL
jgi:transposase InsO family protein